jgi:peroxiredoxin
LAGYRDRFEELSALGFGLAALSVDPPERSRALAEQIGLPFPLLCDQAREVVQRFHLLNRREKGGIAYPATFVLDRDGTVRFRSLERTASRVDLDGLFDFLRQGIGAAAPSKPACCTVVPTLQDWKRFLGNSLRFGIKSPWR